MSEQDSITIEAFLKIIFRSATDVENVLCAASAGRSPGYPIPADGIDKKLRRSKVNAFFSTATAVLSPDGELRNKLAYFVAQYCIVLDDIGTGVGAKVAPGDLPVELRECPSWIIESSPGNFQYGYILDEPIRDVDVARAFTKLVYSSGVADSGGGLCNKLVRLPGGHNVKPKHQADDGSFPAVTLTYWAPENVWSPAELMQEAGCAVSWADLQNDVAAAVQRDPRRGEGATASRNGVEYSMHGVVDEVLEWLEKRGDVLNQGDDWWDINCPWCHEHDDGNGEKPGTLGATAGYSPLAIGDRPESRAFNCFHDSCSSRKSGAFLEWVVEQGGPSAPIVDPIAKEVARWSFEAQGSTWVDMQHNAPSVPDKGFKNLKAEKVLLPRMTPSGGMGWAGVKKYDLLLGHPGLVRFTGTTYNPMEPPVVDEGGALIVNQCRLPFYSAGEPDIAAIEPVLEFLRYLLPHRGGDDYEWFLDHLAMKVQDPCYRGNAVYMSTPVHGTGRGTLTKILRLLFGESNVGAPSMNELLKGVRGDDKNASLRRLVIVVPEAAEAAAKGHHLNHGQFEVLKQFCDPFPVLMEYDAKYGAKWSELNYSMVIICSNSAEAVRREAGDRRFRHMKNTVQKRQPSYFTPFHAVLDDGGWREHMWRFLLARDVSAFVAGQAAEAGDLEQEESLVMSMTPLDRAVYFALQYCEQECGGAVWSRGVVNALGDLDGPVRSFESMLGLDWESFALRRVVAETSNFPGLSKVRFEGNSVSFRHTTGDAGLLLMQQINAVSDAGLARELWVQGSESDMSAFITKKLAEFEV